MAVQSIDLSGKAPFDNHSRECLEQSEKAQTELLESSCHHKEFPGREKDVVKLKNVQEFRKYWGRLTMAQRNFDEDHEHGCGLFVRRYQASASVVLAFMDEFSQLVNIVKDCIPGYGGMAIATISLLFVVARKKEGTEQNLAATIEAIRDRLPAIDLYKSIYDEKHALDQEMQAMIINAYHIFIEFCISAIRYYMGSGARRWLKALAPGNTHVEARAARVQSSIIAIRRLGEELVAKNVDKIKGVTKKTLGAYSMPDLELQDRFSEMVMDDFRKTFQLEGFSHKAHHQHLDDYRIAIDMDQQGYADVYELMDGASLNQFTDTGVYRRRYTAELSSFLILSGCDNDGHNSP